MKSMILSELINDLIQITIIAGLKVMSVYNKDDYSISLKEDMSPLTLADLESHKIIFDGINAINKKKGFQIPIISEEGSDNYYERINSDYIWLIDPLDGTKEFISKRGEFSINIALIEHGAPIAGTVYLPVPDILYYGNVPGSEAYKIYNASKKSSFTEALNTKNSKVRKDFIIITSKSHMNPQTQKFIDFVKGAISKPISLAQAGSSMKICKVADNTADFYPRLGPTMEWDTAAADSVCRARGLYIRNLETGAPLIYNKQDFHNPFFYITSDSEIERIIDTIDKLS